MDYVKHLMSLCDDMRFLVLTKIVKLIKLFITLMT